MKKLQMEFESNPLDVSMIKNEETEQLAQIFSEPNEQKGNEKSSALVKIPANLIEPSPYNRFDRYVGEKRQMMVDSIKENGILEPLLIRKKPNSEMYEIISGENRWSCGMEAGLTEFPVNITDCDDEQAVMLLTETNLVNREVSFRERIIAYHQQYDIMKKRSGERNDLQEDSEKIDSLDILAKKYGESRTQMHRYIRTAELSDDLINLTGLKKISLDAALRLTALSEEQQKILSNYIIETGVKVKTNQAVEIIKGRKSLNENMLDDIFSNENDIVKPIKSIKTAKFSKYFDKTASEEDMTNIIEKALEFYFEQMIEANEEDEYTQCDEIE